MLNLFLVAVVILAAPVAYAYVRKWLRKRRLTSPSPPKPNPEPEQEITSLLARDSMTGTFPAAQNLPDRPYVVQQTVSQDIKTAAAAVAPAETSIARIRRMSPFKQAIAWSEILGPPKALRDPADEHEGRAGGR